MTEVFPRDGLDFFIHECSLILKQDEELFMNFDNS